MTAGTAQSSNTGMILSSWLMTNGEITDRIATCSRPQIGTNWQQLPPDLFEIRCTALREPMAEYRAYVIGSDGHIVSATELVCENDEAAIAEVKTLLLDRTIEIWSRDRFVIRLGPER
jgi:hypothetical protein